MSKHKRPRLSSKQKLCLEMIGVHGLAGSHTEFSSPSTRRTVHALANKKLVQWIENRWILTRDGYAEWIFLVGERASANTG